MNAPALSGFALRAKGFALDGLTLAADPAAGMGQARPFLEAWHFRKWPQHRILAVPESQVPCVEPRWDFAHLKLRSL